MPEPIIVHNAEKVNEIIAKIQQERIKAKLILNFDGKGNITPELTVHNESLYHLLCVNKINDRNK